MDNNNLNNINGEASSPNEEKEVSRKSEETDGDACNEEINVSAEKNDKVPGQTEDTVVREDAQGEPTSESDESTEAEHLEHTVPETVGQTVNEKPEETPAETLKQTEFTGNYFSNITRGNAPTMENNPQTTAGNQPPYGQNPYMQNAYPGSQWSYEAQNNFDKNERKKKSKGSAKTFAIVMAAVFGTAIITLIVAMLLGSALYKDDKIIREEIVKTVYVHEDGVVGGKLTIPEVYEKMKMSTVEISVTASDGSGTGTGIIMTEDGYVITNAHVVEGAKTIKITFYDKKSYDAELIGLDTLADVALVKITGTTDKFTPAEFGSSSDLLVGEAVVAIGCPAGYFLTVTNGIVSALPTTIEIYEEDGYTEKEMYLLQTSAPLNPGNSGGPLCNLDGQVIGINTLKMVQGADGIPYEGLGFSIPINEALDIINDIKDGKPTAGGEISKKAMKLGIQGIICAKGEDDGKGGKYGASGVYVVDVQSGSNADGNLKAGDIIVSYEGNSITEFDPFSSHIKSLKDGDKLSLAVYRDGKMISVVLDMSIYK